MAVNRADSIRRAGAILKGVLFAASVILIASLVSKSQVKEEQLINKVPAHLPVKLEILNGNSEDLLNDLKVKVRNVGSRPIYFLKFYISTKEDFLSLAGTQYGFPMVFGRREFISFSERAISDDVPIKPGEAFVFRVDKKQVRNFKEGLKRDSRSEPDEYILEFIHLSFGDGSGYTGTKGAPFPQKQ